ncbi:MAG: basic amino acid ABC transporter substrate-binding protein [Bacillaceae bacterium]|nr:basic amino acid ABC transporter substrate-binding protein [Bacillaceae bacterium]
MLAIVTAACGTGTTETGGQEANNQENTGGSESGQNGEATEQEEPLKIVVGTDAAYAPFEYVDTNGNIVGFDIEVMNAIAEAANLEVEYKNTAWDGIFLTVQNGERDALISAITITEERAKKMDFSEPYFEATQLIAVPKDSDVTKFEDLKNDYKIGVQNGTTGDEAVSDLIGRTNGNIARFETTPLALKELENGGVEAVVADNAVVLEYIKNNPDANFKSVSDDNFPKEYYGIAVKKGNTELLDRINAGLKEIQENGTYDEIFNKYFGTE